jgi:aminoglycoside/choline kinase family phosphotransferase
MTMQNTETEGLPEYDAKFLRSEMELMPEWYLSKHLGLTVDEETKTMLDRTMDDIISVVLSQPQGVFVHRDFHSRNLMFGCSEEIVVIDYQDARVGALTYDLVSLLRDVYVEVDPYTVEMLALRFRDKKGLDVSDETFMKWFDFTGLQRHLKILGIFSRLAIRDGKENYLNDIPLTLKYILEVGSKYPETQDLVKLLKKINV